jgi:hypothetical protein
VEHLCYKCQASIDESLPFCPHCGAPQIRVAAPDDGSAPAPGTDAPYVSPAAWPGAAPAYHPNAIQWEVAFKGAFLTGLIAAILSTIPIVGWGCCLWLIGTGAAAVGLYQRRIPGVHVTPGMGLRIGAVSGFVAYAASTIWSVFRFTRDSDEFRRVLAEQVEKSMASNPDPRAQDIMRQFMNNLSTPEGLATFFVMILVIMAIVFVIFSAAGGALGASIFARRRNLS